MTWLTRGSTWRAPVGGTAVSSRRAGYPPGVGQIRSTCGSRHSAFRLYRGLVMWKGRVNRMLGSLQPPHRTTTLALVALAVILAVAAVLIGIDDNPPGAALAALSGVALVTAFVHHWRSPKRFLLLSAASLGAVVVLVALGIAGDVAVTGNRLPASVTPVVESAGSTLFLAIAFLGVPCILVGLVGGIVVWLIRRTR